MIYADIYEHSLINKELKPIVDFFEKYFDIESAQFTHRLICAEIEKLLKPLSDRVLHISNLNWENLYQFNPMLNFEYLFKKYRGKMNHYNDRGNQIIYQAVLENFKD